MSIVAKVAFLLIFMYGECFLLWHSPALRRMPGHVQALMYSGRGYRTLAQWGQGPQGSLWPDLVMFTENLTYRFAEKYIE